MRLSRDSQEFRRTQNSVTIFQSSESILGWLIQQPQRDVFSKTNVKDDPARRWHRPDRHFFANGACQVLAYAFLERHSDLGFRARWIKPAAGYVGNHIFVTDGHLAFDYHGLTTEDRLLSLSFRRAQRFFPGWTATLVDLPTGVLVSEAKSREIDGLWLREPKQFLHDALPRARAFLCRFGDLGVAVLKSRAGREGARSLAAG